MNRDELIRIISDNIKLIRTEYDYTQEQMVELIGISKKTLVQIEKRRIDCGWSIAIIICTLFRKSTILQNVLGGNPLMFMELAAGNGTIQITKNENNDKIWWKTIESKNNWRIQQNLVHTSFRIISPEQHAVFYTLTKDIAFQELDRLT